MKDEPPYVSAKRNRINSIGFDYDRTRKLSIFNCNLCGFDRLSQITTRDRYGYLAPSSRCETCGLIFLNPVMHPDEYHEFYNRTYRPLVSAYHGRRIDSVTIQTDQRGYANDLLNFLKSSISLPRDGSLLDVGGSTGIVAHILTRHFRLKASVLDPSLEEVSSAQQIGVEAIQGMIETVDLGKRQFNLIVLCQTIDHLLDISATLSRIHSLVLPDGYFFVDIVDFMQVAIQNQSLEAATKIDHPYGLTKLTASAYLTRAGFKIIRILQNKDRIHVGYLCERSIENPSYLPRKEDVVSLWENILRGLDNREK
jgi:2-polyprenyl-3-methyl-5-hydroxy-6-metoxy-1,4-benzoquinol methylase